MRMPALLLAVGLVLSAALAAEPPAIEERVEVQLLLLDIQVLDHKGDPVPGLTAKDFDVSLGGRTMPLASFDELCSASSQKPAVVFAFDYQHLDQAQRSRALLSARRALAQEGLGDLELMVVALTGELRVEQPFTTDLSRIPAALERMDEDLSLRAGNFAHTSDDGFVRGLTALFDVVATAPRPKAILLYSAMHDVPLDQQFRDLAAMAAASRSVIYAVDVRGLDAVDPFAASVEAMRKPSGRDLLTGGAQPSSETATQREGAGANSGPVKPASG